jgi:xylan 1,4-beta-xylosidase
MKTLSILLIISILLNAEMSAQQKTYCNPLNIDYGHTPLERFTEKGKHRTTADPVIVFFKGRYYLFSTNQGGYWWSEDLSSWNYLRMNFVGNSGSTQIDSNAPAAFVMKDALYVIASSHEADIPLWRSNTPELNQWEIAVDTFKTGAWDPAFFYDQEINRLFLYWGSSNDRPLLGTEVNVKTLQSEGFTKAVIGLHDEDHGWERFGEYNDNTFLQPFIEGAWMTKYNGKYYLQYSAPGTEFSGYADGVYLSSDPLDGFAYQSHNPFSYKPGGFIRGAGHGATFQDQYDNWWHTSTMVIGVKNNFERRIGMWPSGFDADGVMYCNTAFGDYPTYLPIQEADHLNDPFTGWMLLNYQKPVKGSSTFGGFQLNYAVDEDIKSYWSAKSGNPGEWFQSDLGEISTIRAIQVNFADQDVHLLGKIDSLYHQYKIFISNDEKKWKVLIDKSQNKKDVPHDYIELSEALEARFVKIEIVNMPAGKFALSGFRVFGRGNGDVPPMVENFIALRADPGKFGERRSAWLSWKQNPLADGYVIYWGKAPEKLYGSIMVYGKNDYYFTGMDRTDSYYFQIEAFNNNGTSELSKIYTCP